MKHFFLLSFVIFLSSFVFAQEVKIVPNRPLQEQFNRGQATYVVAKATNLRGKTIKIPTGAKLVFRGGSLKNGSVSGSFFTEGVKRGSFNVTVTKGSQLLSLFPVYNYTPSINASVLSACTAGIVLQEDIDVSSDVYLKCSLDGNNKSIRASSSPNAVLRIKDSHRAIIIKRVMVQRRYSGEINKNYALYCENSSNVTVEDSSLEGRLYFVNKTASDSPSDKSTGFVIRNCYLTCDLSACPQGWENGQDHIAFYSICDVSFCNCRIISTNVNRVIKTSQYFPRNDYSVVSHCTDNVLFKDNQVIAKSAYGKQMWDMYCGSTNITIQDNTFDIDGFTRFIEDKAYQDKYSNGSLVASSIFILNNTVKTIGSDLFQFRTSPNCDEIVIRGNSFIMGGPNNNHKTGFVRSCGGYLQGYKSMLIADNSFVWEDEAKELLFLKVNFKCSETRIENNTFVDVYRINMSSATHPEKGDQSVSGQYFKYSGNIKKYSARYKKSREEIYMSDTSIQDMNVDLANNPFNNSYEVIFAKNTSIGKMKYNSKAKSSKSYYNPSKTTPWKHLSR